MLSFPKRKRGRPKRIRLRPATTTVSDFCDLTGKSRSTAFRDMAAGRLRFVQETPGGIRRIPFSEFIRHGYDVPDVG
jgi:hypothetical protein